MDFRSSLGIIALATALSITAAPAFDDSKYPDFSGVWRKPTGIGNQWDQTKPLGRAQEPPFTPEYQAIFEASLADIRAGGQGNDAPSRCVPFAMPRVMTVVFDMEIVITPGTTYMLFAHSMPRRILTDGSDWPKEIEPTFLGYSIGRWVNDGRYDALEIETRGLKGGSGEALQVGDRFDVPNDDAGHVAHQTSRPSESLTWSVAANAERLVVVRRSACHCAHTVGLRARRRAARHHAARLVRRVLDRPRRPVRRAQEQGNQRVVAGHLYWTTALAEIEKERAAGKYRPIVLIGHSQGANNVIDISRSLQQKNIPVDLVITLAPFLQYPIPNNVVRAVNFYQSPGWGAPITGEANFHGKIVNVNMKDDPTVLHINIDKSSKVHADIVREILALSQAKTQEANIKPWDAKQ